MKTIVNNIELSSAFNRINNSFAFDLCVYCVIGLTPGTGGNSDSQVTITILS
jgi:hypothetical protein